MLAAYPLGGGRPSLRRDRCGRCRRGGLQPGWRSTRSLGSRAHRGGRVGASARTLASLYREYLGWKHLGLPEVDRRAGGTTPQRGRRPTGRLLAAGLQVLHSTAHPAGPQRPSVALGQRLARPGRSRSGKSSQRRQRDRADRCRGGPATHQPRSRVGARTARPLRVIKTAPYGEAPADTDAQRLKDKLRACCRSPYFEEAASSSCTPRCFYRVARQRTCRGTPTSCGHGGPEPRSTIRVWRSSWETVVGEQSIRSPSTASVQATVLASESDADAGAPMRGVFPRCRAVPARVNGHTFPHPAQNGALHVRGQAGRAEATCRTCQRWPRQYALPPRHRGDSGQLALTAEINELPSALVR